MKRYKVTVYKNGKYYMSRMVNGYSCYHAMDNLKTDFYEFGWTSKEVNQLRFYCGNKNK